METESSRRWLADAAMILVALIWGSNNVVMKASLHGWVTPLAFNALRFGVGAVALLGLMMLLEKDWRLPRHLWWKVALLGLVGNAVNQVLYVSGLNLTTASNTGIIAALIPVLVALGGALTGLDRATARLWVGAAVSFGGILLVTMTGRQGFGQFQVGDLLLLGASTTWAGYTVFANPLAKQATPLKVSAYAMALGAVVLLLVGTPDLLRQDWSQVTPASWAGLMYASLFSNAAGFAMYVWSVHRIGSTRASLWTNLNPLITAACAWVFLGERWFGWQWVGAALVMAGVLTARWETVMASLRKAA